MMFSALSDVPQCHSKKVIRRELVRELGKLVTASLQTWREAGIDCKPMVTDSYGSVGTVSLIPVHTGTVWRRLSRQQVKTAAAAGQQRGGHVRNLITVLTVSKQPRRGRTQIPRIGVHGDVCTGSDICARVRKAAACPPSKSG